MRFFLAKKSKKYKIKKMEKLATKLETTTRAQRLRNSYTDEELAKKIGISKPTLYTRFTKHNWKTAEIFLIQKLN